MSLQYSTIDSLDRPVFPAWSGCPRPHSDPSSSPSLPPSFSVCVGLSVCLVGDGTVAVGQGAPIRLVEGGRGPGARGPGEEAEGAPADEGEPVDLWGHETEGPHVVLPGSPKGHCVEGDGGIPAEGGGGMRVNVHLNVAS